MHCEVVVWLVCMDIAARSSFHLNQFFDTARFLATIADLYW